MSKAKRKVYPPIQVGDRFGRQVVVAESPPRIYGDGAKKVFWLVRCDCGAERPVAASELKKGESKACRGCQERPGHTGPRSDAQRRAQSDRSRKHGLTGSPTYLSWRAMKSRCYRPTDIGYPNYGGRGITVCDRWLNGEDGKSGFECFLEDMGLRPSDEHSLDRVDNEGNYRPGNCIWQTYVEQQRNRRCTAWVDTVNGRMPLAEACERAGIDLETARKRIGSGLSFEHAIELAKTGRRASDVLVDTPEGQKPLREVGRAAVVPYKLFAYRVLRKGWSIDRALSTPTMRRGPLPRKRV